MPSNQINPFNYNIDNFDSGILGPISDNNFRDFLLSHNLQSVDPNIISMFGYSIDDDKGTQYDVSQSTFNVVDIPNLIQVATEPSLYNNMSKPIEDNLLKNPSEVDLINWYPSMAPILNQEYAAKGTSYGVPQTFKLGYAGNVEEWVSDGGYVTTTHEIRDLELFSHSNNKYGPENIIAYNDPDTQPISTGFIQYNTQVQGDVRDQLFNRTLGVGVVPFSTIGSGINYKPDGTNPSELDTIAKKRRGIELFNRLKLNFVDDTVGAINTSPFGLLAGGNLIQRDYTITVPKTKIGKAAQFAANLAGFNLPTSIIPKDAFPQSTGQQVDIPNELLDYTGSGQKSLLFDALYINKYGPTLGDAYNQPTTKGVLKNLAGAGQPPNTKNYLSEPVQPPTQPREKSTIDKINDKVDSLLRQQEEPKLPTEMDDPTTSEDQYGGFYGRFEQSNSVGKSFSSKSGFGDGNEVPLELFPKPPTSYLGTPTEMLGISQGVTDERFDWRTRSREPYNGQPFKKGLLKYTQSLINISKVGDAGYYIGYFDSVGGAFKSDSTTDLNAGHITGAVDPTSRPTRPSKGNTTRNVKIVPNENGGVKSIEGGDFYCRSWSSRRKYHTWDNLIRGEKNWWRIDDKYKDLMTLNENGVPKIAWDSDDNEKSKAAFLSTMLAIASNGEMGAVKRHIVPYMLSIENLAWKDAPQYNSLPLCERGPNGGRIMWFPPYNIDFSDNTSISWDPTTFIGRGEPIYTYNHTERSGSLSFSIVVDHPSVLNQMRKDFSDNFTDELVHSFFGGCSGVQDFFKDYLPEKIEKTPEKVGKDGIIEKEPLKPKPALSPPINNVYIYFPNARTDDQCPSPNKGCSKVNTTQLGRSVFLIGLADPNGYEVTPDPTNCITGLNEGKEDELNILAKFLVTSDGKNYTIKVNGYCSGTASTDYNQKLGNDRALATRDYLLTKMQDYESEQGGPPKFEGTDKTYKSETELQNSKDRWVITSKGESGAPPDTQDEDWKVQEAINPCLANGKNENSLNSKQARNSSITLEYTPVFQSNIIKEIENEENKNSVEQQKEEAQVKDVVETAAKYFINECDYFLAMKGNQPFVYNSLVDKLDNFHPAFHAITPEGFNSRLTFLQQCTRQGPQLIDPKAPQNMVFGRPPVCILKIGDFYHTKIIPDSINFTYDPIQWDLNPEGIGVQPMVVKVDMSFKFIGGSSLGGPIKQLQNAVSYNFFANTGLYQKARLVDNYLAKRSDLFPSKVVYGAFLTPGDADNLYGQIQTEINEKQAKAIQTSQETNKSQNGDLNQKLKEEGLKTNGDSTTTSTSGKPPVWVPSPPVGTNVTDNNLLAAPTYNAVPR